MTRAFASATGADAGDGRPVRIHGSLLVARSTAREFIKSIKTAWNATCDRAGITGSRFHDLRREFACRLVESGAEQHDIRDFLGHASITTTSRYLAGTPVRLARALARMESGAIRTKFDNTENRAEANWPTYARRATVGNLRVACQP